MSDVTAIDLPTILYIIHNTYACMHCLQEWYIYSITCAACVVMAMVLLIVMHSYVCGGGGVCMCMCSGNSSVAMVVYN